MELSRQALFSLLRLIGELMRPTSRHIAAIALIVMFLLIGQVIPAAAVTSSRAAAGGKPAISNAALQEALRKAHIQSGQAGQPSSSQSLTQLASQYAQEEAILGANRSTAQQESNSSSGSSTTEILALIAGVLLLAGIAFAIFRDARSVAPATTGGPADAGAGGAAAAAARQRRRRAKAKAARAQRKRTR